MPPAASSTTRSRIPRQPVQPQPRRFLGGVGAPTPGRPGVGAWATVAGFSPRPGALSTWGSLSAAAPRWRNWQTRRSQKPLRATSWGFDSPSRHQLSYSHRLGLSIGAAGLADACEGLTAVLTAVCIRQAPLSAAARRCIVRPSSWTPVSPTVAQRPGLGHPRPAPTAGVSCVDSLGQGHDDPLGSADIGHAPDALVLTDAADH